MIRLTVDISGKILSTEFREKCLEKTEKSMQICFKSVIKQCDQTLELAGVTRHFI